jgi:hypothetical protein
LNLGLGYAKSGSMPTEQTPSLPQNDADSYQEAEKRPLAPAAQRALAEAAARRAEAERKLAEREKSEAPKELAGRGGLDPARYGDWEINGLTADF